MAWCSAIGAPGGARSKSRASGGFKTPSTGGKSGGRGRSTRSSGGVDPQGMVGRRIWRYYPEEDAMNPWVEGFLTDYDPNSGTYTILYDPNRPELESTETGFDFNAISQVRDRFHVHSMRDGVDANVNVHANLCLCDLQ